MTVVTRALPNCWDRKVARLPSTGVLLVATDLQGNFEDYTALKQIYRLEKEAGNVPVLALCGDLVHGPSPDLNQPGAWPDHLGTAYVDQSAALLRDFEFFTRTECAFSLLGNHEHAHIGGPVVPKFYPDEAAILETVLGADTPRMHGFLRRFPLLAVGQCGVVLTHGCPARTEPSLADFECLDYAGYTDVSIQQMYRYDTLASLLWSRMATPQQAKAFLAATQLDGSPNAFVAFGHDVVRDGWETVGREQICVSTSFGLFNAKKSYLRLDLGHRYRSVHDLRWGTEILPLYPKAGR